MCCLCGICDCIKVSCSRLIVYIFQLVMIILALHCLWRPDEWTYGILFKNGTVIGETMKSVVSDAASNIVSGLWPFKVATTTMKPLTNSPSIVFWCILLIATNAAGFFALLLDYFIPLGLYVMAVLCYFFHSLNRFLVTRNKLFIIDMFVFGIILVNCLCVLLYTTVRNYCCGEAEKNQKSEEIMPLEMEAQYDPRLDPLLVNRPQSYPNPPVMCDPLYGIPPVVGQEPWYQPPYASNFHGDPQEQKSHSYYV